MPFAVGQVQDAGLIFLSSMATTVVHSLTCQGGDGGGAATGGGGALPDDQIPGCVSASPESVLATVLLTLCTSTFGLGIAVWVVGWLKLAR